MKIIGWSKVKVPSIGVGGGVLWMFSGTTHYSLLISQSTVRCESGNKKNLITLVFNVFVVKVVYM